MKSIKGLIWIVVVCVLAPAMARGQGTNPVSTAVQQSAAQYSKLLIGSVEAMPSNKFGYSPTPAEMTFGKLAEHMQEFNNTICSKLSDTPAPQDKVKDTDTKETLLAALKASMDYCTQVASKLDDSKMGSMVPWFGGREATMATAVFTLTNGWHDHYAQAAIYLRLNGVLPPTAQPAK